MDGRARPGRGRHSGRTPPPGRCRRGGRWGAEGDADGWRGGLVRERRLAPVVADPEAFHLPLGVAEQGAGVSPQVGRHARGPHGLEMGGGGHG